MAARRRVAAYAVVACCAFYFAGCKGRSASSAGPVTARQDDSVVVAARSIEAVLDNLQRNPIPYNPSAYCVSSGELVDVVAPPDEVLRSVRGRFANAVSATECTRSGQWGSFVAKSTGQKALLLYAKPYVSGDRAFIYSGWYEHTMSARMFLLVFRRDGATWRRESMLRLGAV